MGKFIESYTAVMFLCLFFLKMLASNAVVGGDDEVSAGLVLTLIYYSLDLFVLCIFFFLSFFKGFLKDFLPIFFVFLVVSFSSIINETDFFSHILSMLRVLSPVLCYWVLVKYTKSYSLVENHYKFLFLCFVFVFLTVVFGESSYNRFEYWWPAYIGGVHTTSYFFAVAVVWVCVKMVMKGEIASSLFVYSVSIFILYYGWGVRSSVLFMINAVVFCFYTMLGRQARFFIILGFIFLILISPFMIGGFSVDEFSSGRLSMYEEKFEQVSNRGILESLFGSGAGSDMIETEFWWGEKGAHNDYITWLVETGVMGLAALIWLFYAFYRELPDDYVKGVFLACLATSLFSNGIVVRPMPFYLFSFFAAYVYYTRPYFYDKCRIYK